MLNNTADVFDWADTIPGSLLPQIKSQAGDRFSQINLGGSTYYIFMNMTAKPFNSQLAREAVVTGLNQTAMNRLGSGTLDPTCFFLPPDVPGYQARPRVVPVRDSGDGQPGQGQGSWSSSPGMAGTPVTVWSQGRTPRQQWMTYYTQFLNQIGFKATQKVIADATYFTTIGDLKLHPQTGFADWNQDFPNPVDFYLLLSGKAILPTNNENFRPDQRPVHQQPDREAGLGADDAAVERSPASGRRSTSTSPRRRTSRCSAIRRSRSSRLIGSTTRRAILQPIYGWDWTLVPAEVDCVAVGRGSSRLSRPIAHFVLNGNLSRTSRYRA